MHKIVIPVAFVMAAMNISAQSMYKPADAYLSLCNLSNHHLDVFSFLSNQAALAEIKTISAGIKSERRFMLDEIAVHQLAVSFPTQSGNFGLNGFYSGFTDYNETSIGLAYARKLTDKMEVGVQFNYHTLNIPTYGKASAIDFELGTIVHLTEQLNAGVHLYNPIGGKFGKNKEEKFPSIYSAGLGFETSENFFLSIVAEKQEAEPLNVNAGFQYKIIPEVLIRLGISSANPSLFFGIGYDWKKFILHVTASYHQILGITPGLVLIFNANEKPK